MTTAALLDHASNLKEALVAYACSPGFSRNLKQTLSKLSSKGDTQHDDVVEAVEALLYFRSETGREPLLSRYLRTNKNIVPEDRAVLEAWRDHNVLGVFRIDALHGDRLGLHNVINEMDYNTYATAGSESTQALQRGGYVFTRLVPMGEIWTISGTVSAFAPKAWPEVQTLAAKLLKQFPTLPFTNPAKLELARSMVAKQHATFLDLFGSSLVKGTGPEAYASYRNFLGACNEAAAADNPEARARAVPADQLAPDASTPPGLAESNDAALSHHPIHGVSILTGYGLVESAHRNPPGSAEDREAEVLRGYLEDATVPAYILEDLADAYADTVDAAYQVVLGRPDFSWKRDGAALLRTNKPDSGTDSHIPGVSPVPTSLRDAYTRLG